MVVIQKVLAVGVLIVCVLMLLRLCLIGRPKHMLDRLIPGLSRFPARLLGRWRFPRPPESEARRTTDRSGEWEGNVYKPKAFRGPRKPH